MATQVDDLMAGRREVTARGERVLVTTLTKRMSEDLTDYLQRPGLKVSYLHSDIAALDRVEILRNLRLGECEVLVGVNLLREGLDLPEVSLVAILDADREGFLRTARSLIQTAGRAARNVERRGRDVRRRDDRLDAPRHRRDRAPPHQADRLQPGARHHAAHHPQDARGDHAADHGRRRDGRAPAADESPSLGRGPARWAHARATWC